MVFRRIEQGLARLVEGTFGRMSRTGVQPVELARRLVREMDDGQQPSVSCTYAPNQYDIFLSAADHARLKEVTKSLSTELSEYLTLHARRNGYTLLTRPRVSLAVDEDLSRGSFGIACRFDDQAAAAIAAENSGDASPQRTQVMQAVPAQQVPRLMLSTPTGSVSLGDMPLSIGRGAANAVTLHDDAASRQHAEIVRQGTGWVVRDLGSTNGLRVNGSPTTEHELAPGDVITIGSTDLRVAGTA